MGQIRQPIKSTSINKKNRIIEAGLECFCSAGYYKTTTPEIAKKANVSTGIIYSYFKDKKDIFLHSLDLYFDNLYTPILEKIKLAKFGNMEKVLKDIIEITINSHQKNAIAHEEMIAMSHLDEDVHSKFIEQEQNIIFNIAEVLKQNNIVFEKPNEKIHMAYNLVENLSHEYVFHKHSFIDYDNLSNEDLKTIIMKKDIEIARLKKAYTVKGGGTERKVFITFSKKNMK